MHHAVPEQWLPQAGLLGWFGRVPAGQPEATTFCRTFARKGSCSKVVSLPVARFILQAAHACQALPRVFFREWAVNGRVPGPTIRVREGTRVVVQVRNSQSIPLTIHWWALLPTSMSPPEEGPPQWCALAVKERTKATC